MRNRIAMVVSAAAFALASSGGLADSGARFQADGAATRRAVEHCSVPDAARGWKTLTSVTSSTLPDTVRWTIPSSPEEDWTQAVTDPSRAIYRVRSVQGPVASTDEATVEFAGSYPATWNFPVHATRSAGKEVRARRGFRAVGGWQGSVDSSLLSGGTDAFNAIIFLHGKTRAAAESRVERFGGRWLYAWRVTNGTDADYDFDYGAAAPEGIPGWTGTVPARSEVAEVRLDEGRPRRCVEPLEFLQPGMAYPDIQTSAVAYEPARGGRAGRPSRPNGLPPAFSACGEVPASLLDGDPEHDALVVRSRGTPLVQADSTVGRVDGQWGYRWRVRNDSGQDLAFAWPGAPGEAGEGWSGIVLAGSEVDLRILSPSPPRVFQGRVVFNRASDGAEAFRTAAAAYRPAE